MVNDVRLVRQPLEGVRVIELAMFHAGPGACAILADLGAEVIKIEQLGEGDPSRKAKRVGHVKLELSGGRSVWNEGANRGKKSLTIDLKKKKGREIVYRLVGKSDVFVTSLRRPAIERMNMGYPILSKHNPKLIYAWVCGYGGKGPDRDLGAFDYQGQGRSGMMYAMGEPGMIPLVSQFGLIDQSTSIMTSHAVLTALFMRERTGVGQEVDVSILGTALYMLYMNIFVALVSGREVPRHHRSQEYPLRNYYRCGDGLWMIMTIGGHNEDKYWGPVCRALGHPKWAKDERYDNSDKRFDRSSELVELFDRAFATRPRDHWLKEFARHSLPVTPINKTLDLPQDPQVMENGYIVDLDHPKLGKIKIPGYPVQFSKSWAGTKSSAPELGEHTEAVLTGLGGYSPAEVARLRRQGLI